MKAIKYSRAARQIGSTPVTNRAIATQRHMNSEERLARVYSKAAWRKLRARIKDAGFTQCVRCEAKADMLDHIRPIQIHPSGAFDPSNVQPMCNSCHAWKTQTIDAPNRNPGAYQYSKAHLADVRPEGLKRWAAEYVASGVARRELGSFSLDAPMKNKDEDWEPIC